jgi:hypothetical protein
MIIRKNKSFRFVSNFEKILEIVLFLTFLLLKFLFRFLNDHLKEEEDYN